MVIIYVLLFILVHIVCTTFFVPISEKMTIIVAVVLLGLLVLINLNPLKLSYDEDITNAKKDYDTTPDPAYSKQLREIWQTAILQENKYFIYVFMILAYLPVFYISMDPNAIHKIPYKLTLSLFFGSLVSSLIIYQMIHGANAGLVTLIIALILLPAPITWAISCFFKETKMHQIIPLLFLILTIVSLIIYTMHYGIHASIITLIIVLILFPFPVVWLMNCFGLFELSYQVVLPIVFLLLTIIGLILYSVHYGAKASIIMLIIALLIFPFPIAWLINCFRT
jgi:hypothetical protein